MVGDITEIPTDECKLYFASVLDLHSRRLLASATSDHPDADLACAAIKMAAAVRGGRAAIDGVIFHTDRGSTYTAGVFTTLCGKLGVSQSMGRVGSCFSITPLRRRSSRPSNTRSCPGTTSPRKPTPARLWWRGAMTSTTADADTAPPH